MPAGVFIFLIFSVSLGSRAQAQIRSAAEPGALTTVDAKTTTAEPPSLPAIQSSVAHSENDRLREQIQSTLRKEPSLASSRVEVEVNSSQIVLSGSVPTQREKQAAYRLAQSYGNNRRVVDDKVNVQSTSGPPVAQGRR
jgi:osmotically-inducible protein OsmY